MSTLNGPVVKQILTVAHMQALKEDLAAQKSSHVT